MEIILSMNEVYAYVRQQKQVKTPTCFGSRFPNSIYFEKLWKWLKRD